MPTPPIAPDAGWTQATRQAEELVAVQAGETAPPGAGLEPMPEPGPITSCSAEHLAWEASNRCKGLRITYAIDSLGSDALIAYVLQPNIDLTIVT